VPIKENTRMVARIPKIKLRKLSLFMTFLLSLLAEIV